jgi:aspergillopepsin I
VKADLKEPLFAVTLKYHAAGTYDFGFLDQSKYTGDITYVNVNNSGGFWQFKAEGYAVGDDAAKATTIDAIGDTGTTLVYLPSAILKAYYGKVTGAQDSNSYGGWVFPCTSKLPDLTLTIGKSKQTIPGQHINYAPVDTGSPTCYGGLQVNSGLPFSILGDVFLKSKYVVHESGDKPRLGFAKQAS